MPGIDWDTVSIAWNRLGLVFTVWCAFMGGFGIRYALRDAGWARWTVRVVTLATWTVAVIIPARLLLLPIDGDVTRSRLYWTLDVAALPVIAFQFLAVGRIRNAVENRPSRRAAMFRAIQSAGRQASAIESAEDRERLDLELADLDRFVEPETFEYIHLVRSGIVSSLDGGPLAAAREARWATRSVELSDQLRPASWQPDRIAMIARSIRGRVLASGWLLGIGAGIVLGRSEFAGPVSLATPATIVAGYLLTWRWSLVAGPIVGGAAVGLGVTALIQAPNRPADTLLTAALLTSALALWALVEWRAARRRPDLRLMPGGEAAPAPSRPRAS